MSCESFYATTVGITPAMKQQYEKKAREYWNKFYAKSKGFVASSKPRHYFTSEFINEFSQLGLSAVPSPPLSTLPQAEESLNTPTPCQCTSSNPPVESGSSCDSKAVAEPQSTTERSTVESGGSREGSSAVETNNSTGESDVMEGAMWREVLGLEAGCGVGHTMAPLLAEFPMLRFVGVDISSRAINLLKANTEIPQGRVTAFVCDLQKESLPPSLKVDFAMLIFVLSTISPEAMPTIASKLFQAIRPKGYLLLRDYGHGDYKHKKLLAANPASSRSLDGTAGHFFARPDGTRVYFFETEFLASVMTSAGFTVTRSSASAPAAPPRRQHHHHDPAASPVATPTRKKGAAHTHNHSQSKATSQAAAAGVGSSPGDAGAGAGACGTGTGASAATATATATTQQASQSPSPPVSAGGSSATAHGGDGGDGVGIAEGDGTDTTTDEEENETINGNQPGLPILSQKQDSSSSSPPPPSSVYTGTNGSGGGAQDTSSTLANQNNTFGEENMEQPQQPSRKHTTTTTKRNGRAPTSASTRTTRLQQRHNAAAAAAAESKTASKPKSRRSGGSGAGSSTLAVDNSMALTSPQQPASKRTRRSTGSSSTSRSSKKKRQSSKSASLATAAEESREDNGGTCDNPIGNEMINATTQPPQLCSGSGSSELSFSAPDSSVQNGKVETHPQQSLNVEAMPLSRPDTGNIDDDTDTAEEEDNVEVSRNSRASSASENIRSSPQMPAEASGVLSPQLNAITPLKPARKNARLPEGENSNPGDGTSSVGEKTSPPSQKKVTFHESTKPEDNIKPGMTMRLRTERKPKRRWSPGEDELGDLETRDGVNYKSPYVEISPPASPIRTSSSNNAATGSKSKTKRASKPSKAKSKTSKSSSSSQLPVPQIDPLSHSSNQNANSPSIADEEPFIFVSGPQTRWNEYFTGISSEASTMLPLLDPVVPTTKKHHKKSHRHSQSPSPGSRSSKSKKKSSDKEHHKHHKSKRSHQPLDSSAPHGSEKKRYKVDPVLQGPCSSAELLANMAASATGLVPEPTLQPQPVVPSQFLPLSIKRCNIHLGIAMQIWAQQCTQSLRNIANAQSPTSSLHSLIRCPADPTKLAQSVRTTKSEYSEICRAANGLPTIPLLTRFASFLHEELQESPRPGKLDQSSLGYYASTYLFMDQHQKTPYKRVPSKKKRQAAAPLYLPPASSTTLIQNREYCQQFQQIPHTSVVDSDVEFVKEIPPEQQPYSIPAHSHPQTESHSQIPLPTPQQQIQLQPSVPQRSPAQQLPSIDSILKGVPSNDLPMSPDPHSKHMHGPSPVQSQLLPIGSLPVPQSGMTTKRKQPISPDTAMPHAIKQQLLHHKNTIVPPYAQSPSVAASTPAASPAPRHSLRRGMPLGPIDQPFLEGVNISDTTGDDSFSGSRQSQFGMGMSPHSLKSGAALQGWDIHGGDPRVPTFNFKQAYVPGQMQLVPPHSSPQYAHTGIPHSSHSNFTRPHGTRDNKSGASKAMQNPGFAMMEPTGAGAYMYAAQYQSPLLSDSRGNSSGGSGAMLRSPQQILASSNYPLSPLGMGPMGMGTGMGMGPMGMGAGSQKHNNTGRPGTTEGPETTAGGNAAATDATAPPQNATTATTITVTTATATQNSRKQHQQEASDAPPATDTPVTGNPRGLVAHPGYLHLIMTIIS
ncbi:Methyltransferase type 12 [Pelomyxa schiedti]|nr:Methyltransferase type 12 [Pelomyxa schiedti]